jgi:hypothetical protein
MTSLSVSTSALVIKPVGYLHSAITSPKFAKNEVKVLDIRQIDSDFVVDCIEMANNNTVVFLDEVGKMPIDNASINFLKLSILALTTKGIMVYGFANETDDLCDSVVSQFSHIIRSMYPVN